MDTSMTSGALEPHRPGFKPVMYVHAGYPKTGTTTIQQFLTHNRAALKDMGVLYPKTGIQGSGHVKFATPFLGRSYLSQMRKSNLLSDAGNASQIKKQIAQEISESGTGIKSVIVSAESFHGADNEGLRKLVELYKADFELKAVIYLRRQERYAESIHAQAYRVREVGFNRDQLLRGGDLNYDKYINLWIESFGSDNLILREYPEKAFNGQLINDFLTAVSIGNLPVPTDSKRLNTRLDRLMLEYIRYHTELKFGDDIYFRVVILLNRYGQNHPVENKFQFFFSPQEHQLIMEDCRQSNTDISEKYFNGGLFKGPLNSDSMTEWEKFPGLSESQVESIDAYLSEHGIDIEMLGRR